jgi:hypothetical protein
MSTKVCTKCNVEKSLDDYHRDKYNKDGRESRCKICKSKSDYERSKTLRAVLIKMLSHAKYHSKSRKDKGREEAGECTITISDLEEQWNIQDGKCWYSNIPMNIDKNDWKMSLERLDTDKGYIKDNVVFCCREFNNSSQWSYEKIQEMLDILDKGIESNTVSFENPKKERGPQRNIEKFEIDGIKHFICNFCSVIKPMSEHTQHGCKTCKAEKEKYRKETPRATIQSIISHAKSHSKDRENRNVDKRDNSVDIDFDFLVELFNKQKGLCAYSGIPLQFGSYHENNWTVSLERIDVSKGYVKDNVCLICLEFNTSNQTVLYKHDADSRGNAGFTKEKFQVFLKSVKNNQ